MPPASNGPAKPLGRPRECAGRVSVHLLPDQYNYVTALSDESGASRSLIARRLIGEALAARAKKGGHNR
jgi:hypothetical protein